MRFKPASYIFPWETNRSIVFFFQGKLVEGDFGTALPLIIFGGLSVIAGLLSLILPETKGKILPETIADAQQFGR